MTTIAYRDGIIAADSRETLSKKSYGDVIVNHRSQKLFLVRGSILATYGDSSPGLIFVDWWKQGAKRHSRPRLEDYDFGILVLAKGGQILHYDNTLHAEILDSRQFYAFGSGSKGALCAMWAGADAERAALAACMVDPWSAPPIIVRKWHAFKASRRS